MRDLIPIRCEGSGEISPHWLCPMCGVPVDGLGGGGDRPLIEHNRRDILAELRRGDFDPLPATKGYTP